MSKRNRGPRGPSAAPAVDPIPEGVDVYRFTNESKFNLQLLGAPARGLAAAPVLPPGASWVTTEDEAAACGPDLLHFVRKGRITVDELSPGAATRMLEAAARRNAERAAAEERARKAAADADSR